MSRLLRFSSILCTFAFLLSNKAQADITPSATVPTKVYVIHAKEGSLNVQKGAAGLYTLKLSGVSKVVALGSSSESPAEGLQTRDFFDAWRTHAAEIKRMDPRASLRASRRDNRFFATVNLSSPHFDTRTNELTLSVAFISYNSQRPDLEPELNLTHPMIIIAENALPKNMVETLDQKTPKEKSQKSAESSSLSSPDEAASESTSDDS